MQCARHPDVETELGCSRCGTAICPKCLVYTPVGTRCPDCAQVRKIPTYNMQAGTLPKAIAAALVAAIALGIAWWFFDVVTYFFFGVFAGFALGIGMSEAVALATNRKRGPPLQIVAVCGIVLAYLIRVGLLLSFDWDFGDLRGDIWGLLVMVFGIMIAVGRLR